MKVKSLLLVALSALLLGACNENKAPKSEDVVPTSESGQPSETSSSAQSSEEGSSEEESSSEEVPADITSVTISGIVAPVVDALTNFNFVVETEHVQLDMASTWWMADNGLGDYSFFDMQAFNDKTFEPGVIYCLRLAIETTDDMKFSQDADIHLKIGAETVDPSNTYWGSSRTSVTAYYYFDKLPGKRPIHAAQITNYPLPAVGEHPGSLANITVEPSTWVKLNSYSSNIYWVYFNGGTANFFARGGEEDKTFAAGTKYGISIIVECKDNENYAFAEDFQAIVATGKGTVFEIEKCGSGDLNRRITIAFETL